MKPLVSVVMPAYQAEPWLEEALASVLAQSMEDWQLIIVDDGSTDGTAGVAAGYLGDGRVQLIRQRNAGQSAAQNRGLRACRGEYVLFMDADDRLCPGALRHLHAALRGHKGVVLAYGVGRLIGEEGRPFGRDHRFRLMRKPTGAAIPAILTSDFVGMIGVALIRTDAARAIGGFNTDLVMGQDWEFWCRLATMGQFRFAGNTVVYEYRLRAGSVARSVGSVADCHGPAIEAVFENPGIQALVPPRRLRRLRRRRQAKAQLFAAVEAVRAADAGAARRSLRRALADDPFLVKAMLLYLVTLMASPPGFVRARLGIPPPDTRRQRTPASAPPTGRRP